MDVKIPEPFVGALREGRPREVCDASAGTPEALYGRAMARIQAGRDRDARSDLQAAHPALGDACLIELVYLELRTRTALEDTVERGRSVLGRAPAGSPLKARSYHIVGLGEGKLGHPTEAVKALLEASGLYRALGDRYGRAQVQDTLGTLHASQGRMDLALSAYAISLVEKTICGDRYGTAITLGNLGRIHLRVGRFSDALDCFELNHSIASELGDRRGCARALEDMGRAYLEMGDLQGAQDNLRRSLRTALEEGYKDLEFFSYKDLALVYLASGELDRSARELELAEQALSGRSELYLELLLETVRGELFLARGDDRALEILEETARKFGEIDIPDYEIPLWITLARAYTERKLKRTAQVCLERALARARRDGYERYLRRIRETMAGLGGVAELADETGRLPGLNSTDDFPDGYTVLEKVGGGAFGEVFRAYDPLEDQMVAIKRIRLEKIYEMKKRKDLLSSARSELEAAAPIQHPGVARVFAIGRDSEGGLYIVQEFVKGRSLRELMKTEIPADPGKVFETIGFVASALEALHQQGVIHRDLKPENILLRAPDDSPVLVDFGVAFVSGFQEGFASEVVVGTLPYMAPEQLLGRAASNKADLYSLGVVLIEWLTGKLPFNPEGSRIQDVLRAKRVPLTEICVDLDPRHRKLVGQLLDPDPVKRPQAGTVADTCKELVGEGSGAGRVGSWKTVELSGKPPDNRFEDSPGEGAPTVRKVAPGSPPPTT